MAEIDTDDIHPALMEILGEWSDMIGRSEGEIAQLLEIQYDLDVSEVESDDAVRFRDAYDDGDVDTMVDVLEANDVSDEHIDQFKAEIQAMSGDDPGDDGSPSGNGQTPQASTDAGSSDSGGGSGLTEAQRREVAQIVQQSTPETDEIAQRVVSSLQNQAAGGGGSSGGGEGQAQGQQQLGQLISLAQLAMGNQGGGQMAELGQMMDKAAKKRLVQQLTKPSLGDIIEMRMYEKMSDKYADEWMQEMFEGDPFEDLDEANESGDDGDSSSGWSFL